MKFLIYLSAALFPFAFSGCGESPEEKLSLAQDSLVRQYINKKYNDYISEASDYKSFIINDSWILLVSSGVWNVPQRNACTEAHVYRKYNAFKLTLSNVTSERKKMQKSNNSKYPYRATVLVSYMCDYEVFDGIEGVVIGTILPPEWNTFSMEKKQEYFNKHLAQLPDEKYDFLKILQSKGRWENNQQQEHIQLHYSSASKSWEFEKNEGADSIKATTPDWRTLPLSAISDVMKSKGFQQFGQVFFSAADVPVKQKIDAGYSYYNGHWVSKEGVALAKALEKHPQRGFSLSDIENLLFATASNPKAEDYENARKIIYDHTQRLIQSNADDIKAMIVLQKCISTDEKWNIIDKNKLLEQIAAEIKNCEAKAAAPLNDFEKNVIAFGKSNDPVLALTLLDNSRKFGNHDLELATGKFIMLWGMLARNKQVGQAVEKYNSGSLRRFRESLMIDCPYCQNGRPNCNFCRNTRVCYTCDGRGRKRVTRSSFSNINHAFTYEYCNPRCTSCPSGKCARCGGIGRYWKNRQTLAENYKRLYRELLNFIAAHRQKSK